VIWLPFVGQSGWVAITKDKAQRYNHLEKAAIIDNKVRQFSFTSGNINRDEMADLLRRHLREIFRFIEKHSPPFVASITQSGVNPKSLG
jgi:predicted nuclease of predicted toxin-antitoxin system